MSDDSNDNTCDQDGIRLRAILNAPLTWRTPSHSAAALAEANDDTNGNPEEIEESEESPSAACGSATSNRSTSSDSCDIENDLIFNPDMVRALDVIKFHILFEGIGHEAEVITQPFGPTMAHQIFGTDEVILGYRNLVINFTILPNSFHTKLEYTYHSVRKNVLRGQMPDNIEEKLQEWFPHLIREDAFVNAQKTENLMNVYGDVLLTFPMIDKNDVRSSVYITQCDSNNADFMAFHKRFQALIVFFIDAASIIDFDDPNWMYFYVYKDVFNEEGKIVAKLPIGFCTLYKFVLSKRLRVSQFFILPNYQQRGLGSRFLAFIYEQFRNHNEYKYITVECPCDEFSMLRDKLDLRLIIDAPEFSRENVLEGYTPAMAIVGQKRWKFSSDQVKHLVQVLRRYYSREEKDLHTKFFRDLKLDVYNSYKRKLLRVTATAAREERINGLRRIVDDDYLLNRTIHRDVSEYLRRISPHMRLIENLLTQTES